MMEITSSAFLWGTSTGQALCWGKVRKETFMIQSWSFRTSELGQLNKETKQLANIEGKALCEALTSTMEVLWNSHGIR